MNVRFVKVGLSLSLSLGCGTSPHAASGVHDGGSNHTCENDACNGGGAGVSGGANSANGGGAPGGASSSGGTAANGGVGSTSAGAGGTAPSASGGAKSSAGAMNGGAAAIGGSSAAGMGSGGAGTSGSTTGGAPGNCDAGSTKTTWASNCPTTPASCTAGAWVAGGPDPDHRAFELIAESAHFAIYSDENVSATTASSALDTLENTIWKTYFGSPIFFREPLCNSATKTKASIHVHSDWGLTGGSWAANRMGMWIGSGALADHWGLGHEFMHGVQSVSGGLECGGSSNYCGWIYESHANFMPHQLLEYRTNEHCTEMSFNAPHLYLGSTRDRYCNWQFMEYLKDKYCYSAVNDIWTSGPSNDPFSNIMKARGWNISQLNDFFGEWAMHNVTWDYKNPAPTLPNDDTDPSAAFRASYGSITDTSKTERRLRITRLDPLAADYATTRRFMSPYYWAPQRWGYNVARLYPDTDATSVTVAFRGVTQSGANSDWRWGLVATSSTVSNPRYSALQRGADASLTFCVQAGESLWLVVMGTPSVQQQINWDQAYTTIYRYPYMVELGNAWPEGFQGGMPAPCPSGTTRVSNGGGCGPANLPASVYVGPYAAVLGGTVSGAARIEDHAVVVKGTVSGGTVGALTSVGSNSANAFTISGSAKAMTTFYPLGFFEPGQSLADSGTLYGDVEFRGANFSLASGSYSGIVSSSEHASAGPEVTMAPPYSWRP
jgi:hypothetical protein